MRFSFAKKAAKILASHLSEHVIRDFKIKITFHRYRDEYLIVILVKKIISCFATILKMF